MQKWISNKAKGGGKEVWYHTIEECRYLESVEDYRKANERELEWHDAKECSNCRRIRLDES